MTNACKTPEAVMQTLITALAAGLAVWGVVQLSESFQSGGERQRAQALDLIKAGGEIVRTATWESYIGIVSSYHAFSGISTQSAFIRARFPYPAPARFHAAKYCRCSA